MPRHLLYCLLLVWLPAAAQTTVYKTVTSDGQVIFSDQPPLTGSVHTETLYFRAQEVTPSPEDQARFQAMREVTAKITEERLARENTRLEQKAQQPVYAPYAQPYYHSGGGRRYYPNYPVHPNWGLIGQPATNTQYPAKLVRQYYSDHVQRALQPNRVSQPVYRPTPYRQIPLR